VVKGVVNRKGVIERGKGKDKIWFLEFLTDVVSGNWKEGH
jgi:hypothetical protein